MWKIPSGGDVACDVNDYKIRQSNELTPTRTARTRDVEELQLSIPIAKAVRPLVVDRESKRILLGNQRYEALRRLGFKKVPCYYVEAEGLRFRLNDKEWCWGDLCSGHGQVELDDFQIFLEHDQLSSLIPRVYVSLEELKINVFSVGVFDLFHIGHANLLKNARLLGDNLIVGVQYNVGKYKRDSPICSFEDRAFWVSSLKFVDLVVPYENVHETIQTLDLDIFAVGPDQGHKYFRRAFEYCSSNNIEVRTLPRTERISSSKLRGLVKEEEW